MEKSTLKFVSVYFNNKLISVSRILFGKSLILSGAQREDSASHWLPRSGRSAMNFIISPSLNSRDGMCGKV